MAPKTTTIMLVDDHNIVKEGLRYLIEKDKKFNIVATSSDGMEAIEIAQRFNPHVIVMDIDMPRMNGLDALKLLKDNGVKSKVIIFTAHKNKEYILEATKLGAKGYLFKTCSSEDILKAIYEVSIGRTYIEPSVANVLTQNIHSEITNNSVDLNKIMLLSRREYEVLSLISTGYNNKDIGKYLFISEKTVKNHISKIFKKIEVNDRVQATIFAIESGIRSINIQQQRMK